jgi:hypothetical protein
MHWMQVTGLLLNDALVQLRNPSLQAQLRSRADIGR